MGFYEVQLAILIFGCAIALVLDHRRRAPANNSEPDTDVANEKLEEGGSSVPPAGSGSASARLTRQYLIVYAIVMGADWLQGPYVYSLYKDQYEFPSRTVATLFVTGLLSGGLTAPWIGVFADQHGRKTMCLMFCIIYILSCLLILVPSLPFLFLGRVFGGIATSILYSAFESWLVSSANALALPSADLSSIFGKATLINGVVATTAGVVSNQLVATTSDFASPFVASGMLLVLAGLVIRLSWAENYGSASSSSETQAPADWLQMRRLGEAWQIARKDSVLIALGLTQTCFEGAMYLFVFLWVPSLQSCTLSPLPLGYIFAAFMVSMMLGSLAYSFASSTAASHGNESSLSVHAKLSSLLLAVAALALAAGSSGGEHRTFWAFCLFEACVGIYYPVQGMLRSQLIANEHRATLSALFRVPLNTFVVISLLTGVSDSSARTVVLGGSAAMLAGASVMTASVIVKRANSLVSSGHASASSYM